MRKLSLRWSLKECEHTKMIVLRLGREIFIFILVIFSLNYGAAEPEPDPQLLTLSVLGLGALNSYTRPKNSGNGGSNSLTNLFLNPLGLSFGSGSPSGKDHLIV
jgi:hypothetical protein